jgi:hypothetical protein
MWLTLVLTLVGALSIDASALAATETTVTAITKDPDKFHEVEVLVHGKAIRVQLKTSRRGNPYTLFSLTDPTTQAQVTVYSRGHQAVSESSDVVVQGIYYKVLHRSGFTFTNEIDAFSIRPMRDSSTLPR